MVACEFIYGGKCMEISIPAVPRKDESMMMPDGEVYRVARVRWHFEYEETQKALKSGKFFVDRHKPMPSWNVVDEAIRATIFMEK